MSGKTRTLSWFYQPDSRSRGSRKTAIIKKKVEEKMGRGGAGDEEEEMEEEGGERTKEIVQTLFSSRLSVWIKLTT